VKKVLNLSIRSLRGYGTFIDVSYTFFDATLDSQGFRSKGIVALIFNVEVL
jgi:hypothetical protein